jgi:hypothetical protein
MQLWLLREFITQIYTPLGSSQNLLSEAWTFISSSLTLTNAHSLRGLRDMMQFLAEHENLGLCDLYPVPLSSLFTLPLTLPLPSPSSISLFHPSHPIYSNDEAIQWKSFNQFLEEFVLKFCVTKGEVSDATNAILRAICDQSDYFVPLDFVNPVLVCQFGSMC